jgi:hypothetical protein
MLVLYPVACLVSALLGGLRQCLALIILGFCYNDLGFADRSCITRNLINGIGFVCYASGAVEGWGDTGMAVGRTDSGANVTATRSSRLPIAIRTTPFLMASRRLDRHAIGVDKVVYMCITSFHAAGFASHIKGF